MLILVNASYEEELNPGNDVSISSRTVLNGATEISTCANENYFYTGIYSKTE
jgi:hypothetical protein